MSREKGIEIVARIGFVAKGLLYALVGTLAACAGLGQGGGTTDTKGAMEVLRGLPFGRVALIAIAVGLTGYAVWRFIEGIADPDERGNDAKALALRGSFVARGLIHLGLAFSAAKAASGWSSSGGNGQQTKEAAATAFQLPKGEWIVWIVGLSVAIFFIRRFDLTRANLLDIRRQLEARRGQV